MEMFKGWWDTISKDPVWLWTVLGSCYLFATLIVRSFFFRSLVKRAKTLNSKYYHLIKKTYLQRSLPGWLFYFISFGLAALFWQNGHFNQMTLLQGLTLGGILVAFVISVILHLVAFGTAAIIAFKQFENTQMTL